MRRCDAQDPEYTIGLQNLTHTNGPKLRMGGSCVNDTLKNDAWANDACENKRKRKIIRKPGTVKLKTNGGEVLLQDRQLNIKCDNLRVF